MNAMNEKPRRLWSLWDMQSFYLPAVLELAKEVGRLVRLFEECKPEEFLGSDEVKKTYLDGMDIKITQFRDLDLKMSALQAQRIKDNIDSDLGKIGKMLDELYSRLADECSLRIFLALSEKEAEFALPKSPLFGEGVGQKFPSCSYEIEEAGKCMGFSRHTAAIFHLMRTMEIGIKAVARCLNIPDPVKPAEKNWAFILRRMKEEFERRNSINPPAWSDLYDKEFFEELYVSLDAVRNPWRNATMHVENKYTEEEAEHILFAVKAFMKKLASRMDEEGNPKT